jgi:phosphoribosylformylglycinamidine synthase
MIIGSNIGASVDISNIKNNIREDFMLFSESNTRWMIEIEPKNSKIFESKLNYYKIPNFKIGNTKGSKLKINNKGNNLINLDVETIIDIWKNPITAIMG